MQKPTEKPLKVSALRPRATILKDVETDGNARKLQPESFAQRWFSIAPWLVDHFQTVGHLKCTV